MIGANPTFFLVLDPSNIYKQKLQLLSIFSGNESWEGRISALEYYWHMEVILIELQWTLRGW